MTCTSCKGIYVGAFSRCQHCGTNHLRFKMFVDRDPEVVPILEKGINWEFERDSILHPWKYIPGIGTPLPLVTQEDIKTFLTQYHYSDKPEDILATLVHNTQFIGYCSGNPEFTRELFLDEVEWDCVIHDLSVGGKVEVVSPIDLITYVAIRVEFPREEDEGRWNAGRFVFDLRVFKEAPHKKRDE